MKKNIFTALAVILLSVTSISCSKSDDAADASVVVDKIVGSWKKTAQTSQVGVNGAPTNTMGFCSTAETIIFSTATTGATNGSYEAKSFNYVAPNCVPFPTIIGTWANTGSFYNIQFTTTQLIVNFSSNNNVMTMTFNYGNTIEKETYARQ